MEILSNLGIWFNGPLDCLQLQDNHLELRGKFLLSSPVLSSCLHKGKHLKIFPYMNHAISSSAMDMHILHRDVW